MRCPVCDRPAEDGQRFCTGCGTSLRAAHGADDDTAATSQVPAQPATALPPSVAFDHDRDDQIDESSDWAEPVWAATGSVTAQLPATQPVQPAPSPMLDAPVPDAPVLTPYDLAPAAVQAPITSGYSTTPATQVVPRPAAPARRPRRGFHVTASLLLGVAAGLVAIASLFTTVLDIESSRALAIGPDAPAGFRVGTWLLDDLADNLSIAGLVAAAAMIVGGVASGFGWNWGGGLAGGGGLSFAGVAAIAIGLAQMPIDAATEFARLPADPPFRLIITRDIGYWLLLAAAAAGIVLFFASFNDLTDRRPGLNPWIAALGGLSTLIAAAGPTLPERLGRFDDNWYLVDGPGEAPAMLLAGRAAQLLLLAAAGLLGFLCVRRYGIGLALGGSLPSVWLAVSTLFELTDNPVGPGWRNPGATNTDLHGVTVIGFAALVSMIALAIVAAYDQGSREKMYVA